MNNKIALTLLMVTIVCPAGAADVEAVRKVERLRAECAALKGPSDGAFARLKADCRDACTSFVITQRENYARGDYLIRCEMYRDKAQWYLDGTLFKNGSDYMTYGQPQSTPAPAGSVDVTLFSTLACEWCLNARSDFVKWRQRFPRMTARQMPLMWGYDEEKKIDYDAYARIDVFLDSLGDQELAAKVRKLVHGSRGTAPLGRKLDVHNYLLAAGVDEAALKGLASFSVEAKLRQAQDALRQYRIDRAPTYVLNSRYIVPPRSDASSSLDVVQFLIERDTGIIGRKN